MLENYVFGRNTVVEVLKSKRKVSKIFISKTAKRVEDIVKLARTKLIEINFVEPLSLRKFGEKTQGVVAFCEAFKFFNLADVLEYAKREKHCFFLICDGIKDPHNLGALMRTAYAVGVNFVILPKKRTASINATVEKTSVGAVNFLKIAIVSNLSETIKKLKKEGIFIYSADAQGENYYEFNFKGSVGLVVGSEEKGVSELIKKNSDGILKVPMVNPIDSLNVSVAGAVIMYEILKQNFKC